MEQSQHHYNCHYEKKAYSFHVVCTNFTNCIFVPQHPCPHQARMASDMHFHIAKFQRNFFLRESLDAKLITYLWGLVQQSHLLKKSLSHLTVTITMTTTTTTTMTITTTTTMTIMMIRTEPDGESNPGEPSVKREFSSDVLLEG